MISLAHPQRVASLVSLPLMVIILRATNPTQATASPEFIVTMLIFTVGMSSMMVFSYDGPGVRNLFLLPVRPRDVVLSKNLEFLTRIVVEFALLLVVMAFVMPEAWRPEHVPGVVAGLGVLFVTLTIGTSMGIRFPVRARRRGSEARAAWKAWRRDGNDGAQPGQRGDRRRQPGHLRRDRSARRRPPAWPGLRHRRV